MLKTVCFRLGTGETPMPSVRPEEAGEVELRPGKKILIKMSFVSTAAKKVI